MMCGKTLRFFSVSSASARISGTIARARSISSSGVGMTRRVSMRRGCAGPRGNSTGLRAVPGRDIEERALIGRALADIGVAVAAQHVDRALHGLGVGALAGDEDDTRQH